MKGNRLLMDYSYIYVISIIRLFSHNNNPYTFIIILY